MNFQYSFDYCSYNGIKGDDKSLSIYEGDWRSGGDVITREFAPAHQHEADRHTYEAAVKYLKSHANNPDAIIEKLNQCEWVKQMNEADEAERLGSIYIFKTRVKKSWSNITYNFNYVGDTEEEAEENRMKYGNISGKGNYMPGTGKMYEVVKYKVHGENFYYMHETFEQEDSNQRPCKVKEMLSLVPKNSEFMHIATRRL